jgi:hypothetical protein
MLPNRRTALVLRRAEAKETAWGESRGSASAIGAIARSDAHD